MARSKTNRSTPTTTPSSQDTRPMDDATNLQDTGADKTGDEIATPEDQQSQDDSNQSGDSSEQSSENLNSSSEEKEEEKEELLDKEEDVIVAEVVSTTENVEDEAVTILENLLIGFSESNEVSGKNPSDFENSANLTFQITQFVIRNPTLPVMFHLLKFFKENIDGVCSTNFLKGSTTLSNQDELKVLTLHALFYEMAKGQFNRKSEAAVMSILGRIEILEFYGRHSRQFD